MKSLIVTLLGLSLSCGAMAQAVPRPLPRPAPKPVAKAVPKLPELAVATGEQLAAAAMTYFGKYECEFNQTLLVDINRKVDGYIEVLFNKQQWTMKPVLSTTGALRLEDVKGRMLLLQISNKSMLMDAFAGRRVVDDCVHEKQRAAREAPATSSLGIAPAAPAASAAAAAPAASAASASQ
jgi:hypothetical protein